jgi:hypothetical protein
MIGDRLCKKPAVEDKTDKRGTKILTGNRKNSETQGKDAPLATAHPDPRIVAFVRMLARRAAERDFARHLESTRNARQSTTRTKETKQ